MPAKNNTTRPQSHSLPRRIRTETLIVGAGPAGLACAMELFTAGRDFVVLERQATVGGLSKTYVFKEGDLEFKTDNGPHRFFSKNPKLYEFIEGIINERWIVVHRFTRQYIKGKFYDYPINFFQALRNVGFVMSIRMGFDYAYAKLAYGVFKKPITTFRDYVYANFGKTLGLFNMIHYTEKIWGISADTIHPDWATQRISGLNLFKVIKDTIVKMFGGRGKNTPKSLVDTFYYPQFGTGLIYDTIVEKITAGGRQVLCNVEISEFRHQNGRFTEVLAHIQGEDVIIEFTNLVESVPLPSFVKLVTPHVINSVTKAAAALRYRNQVYLFITLDKASVTKDQWIYFPDQSIPFARISEMRNFSADMSPAGKTSMFVEFFCFEGDATWTMSDAALFESAMVHFEAMKFFTRAEVRKYYVIRAKDVYPIYDLQYATYLDTIKAYLDTFSNLYYIGRPGRFRYNNQDHSLEMGMLAAKSIIDGVKYDIESVGEEKSYQESGQLYEKKVA